MATAIGLALGISLAVAGRRFGFNLRQAGPIAVFIILLLVGFLILHTMLRVHVQWKVAAPLTYVLIYLFLRAVSPALFDVIADRIPFLNLLSAIVFLICVWQVGVALWPKGNGGGGKNSSDASFISGLDQKDEKRGMKVEKKIKRRLTPRAQRETRRLEHDLQVLQKEVQKDTPDWKSISEALSASSQTWAFDISPISSPTDRRIRVCFLMPGHVGLHTSRPSRILAAQAPQTALPQ